MIINEEKELLKIVATSPTIVMLPFAGGNTYSYQEIIKFLPDTINVICPELPGRGILSDKPFITDMETLADYIFVHWIRFLNLNSRYVIFGHSMGALLGSLLVHKIIAHKMKLPEQLIVSGRQGPGFGDRDEWIHTLPSALFREQISLKGGTPDEVLEDELFMAYYEPVIRADMKMSETYVHRPKSQVNIPISVLYGLNEGLSTEAIHSWQQETGKKVKITGLSGGHFFIFDHPHKMAELIAQGLFDVHKSNVI